MISALIDLLGQFYQIGDVPQMETIARSMLASIPDDLVALQFLGLALYQMGRLDSARRVFSRVADKFEKQPSSAFPVATVIEPASNASYREATRPGSMLAEGWYRIGLALNRFGFDKSAIHAFQAAITARGVNDDETSSS